MNIISNPWFIGICTGIISSLVVTFGTNLLLILQDQKRHSVDIYTHKIGNKINQENRNLQNIPENIDQAEKHDSQAPTRSRKSTKKGKLLDYEEWMNREHPVWADIGTWMALYVPSLLLLCVPLVFIIPFHISLRRKLKNEYSLYAAEEYLMIGDYIQASQHIFKLTNWGLSKAHILAVIMSVAAQARDAGDMIRYKKLTEFMKIL